MRSNSIKTSIDGDKITFTIIGEFDYTCRAQFLNCLESISENTKKCHIDLTQTQYLDSSGLGMLLILKSHPRFDENSVSITTKDNRTITDIILNHNFDQLFNIAN